MPKKGGQTAEDSLSQEAEVETLNEQLKGSLAAARKQKDEADKRVQELTDNLHAVEQELHTTKVNAEKAQMMPNAEERQEQTRHNLESLGDPPARDSIRPQEDPSSWRQESVHQDRDRFWDPALVGDDVAALQSRSLLTQVKDAPRAASTVSPEVRSPEVNPLIYIAKISELYNCWRARFERTKELPSGTSWTCCCRFRRQTKTSEIRWKRWEGAPVRKAPLSGTLIARQVFCHSFFGGPCFIARA